MNDLTWTDGRITSSQDKSGHGNVIYRFYFLETLQQHTGLSRLWGNNSIAIDVPHTSSETLW